MPFNKTPSSKRDGARLSLTLSPNAQKPAPVFGLQPLNLGQKRDGLLYVPANYDAARPAPMALMFHGAGGRAGHGLDLLRSFADEVGLLLLAPDSRGMTWDVIRGGYGPDVEFIERALQSVLANYALNETRLAVGGFSDGASYALSLGLSNGDIFRSILAFSPGFMAPSTQVGSPRVFISHGTRDSVLPIDSCSRRIVPQLKSAGYDVSYHEFDGPHTVPADVAREAIAWFLSG